MINTRTHQSCAERPFASVGHKPAFATLAVLLALPLTAPGMDLDRQIQFHIPAQDLAAALIEFSRQTRLQVIVSDDLTGQITQGVTGQEAIKQALNQLLEPAGLRYRVAGETSMTVVRASAMESEPTRASAENSSVRSDQSGADDAQASVDDNDRNGAEPSPGNADSRFDDRGGFLQEIVVTASKRSESLRDVAGSITALTGEQLERGGVFQLADFMQHLPGLSMLTVGQAGRNVLTVRGITTGGGQTSPTVGVYIDDVPFGSTTPGGGGADITPDLDPFDLERVEVLRGPQGTVYGASTLGGLLKYVTRPADLYEYQVGAQAGLAQTKGETGYTLRGRVNLPIVEGRLGMRVSASRRIDPGYVADVNLGTQDVNRTETTGGRISTLFVPTDNLRVKLSALHQDIEQRDEAAVDVDPLSLEPVFGDLSKSRGLATPSELRYRVYSGVVEYDLGFGSLTSVTGFNTYESLRYVDVSGTFGGLVGALPGEGVAIASRAETRKLVEEIRLSSRDNQSLLWLVGSYFTREDSDLDNDLSQPGWQSQSLDFEYREYAAFANVTYFLTPSFDVTAGVRWSSNDQTFRSSRFGRLINPASPTTVQTGINESGDSTWTYLASARLRFGADHLAYARVATGYRPGGPRNFPPVPLPADLSRTYNPDTVISYESGLRTQWLAGRLSLDGSVYYIDWEDIQLTLLVGGFNVFGNAGKARSRGVELEAAYMPTRALTLNASANYSDATIRTDTPAFGAVTGDRLPNVPLWSGSVSADYRFSVGQLGGTLGLTVRHQGDRSTGYSSGVNRLQLPDYTALDLRAGLGSDSIFMDLYLKNVTDERGSAGGVRRSAALPGQVSPILPRTIGLMVSMNF